MATSERILTGKLVFLLYCCCLLACSKAKPEDLHRFSNTQGKHGYADKKGKVLIMPVFEAASEFSEGLAAVRMDGLCGYIDSNGDFAIKPTFQYAGDFFGGVAWVTLNNKQGLVDKEGKYTSFPYDDVERLRPDGFAKVVLSGKVGLIDRTGKLLVQPIYEEVFYDPSFLNRDLFAVRLKGKYGLVNTSGIYVIEPTFDRVDYYAANNFALPYLRVALDCNGLDRASGEECNTWGLMDKSGKIVLAPVVEVMRFLASDLVKVSIDGKWGIMNIKTLELTTEPRCVTIERTQYGDFLCIEESGVRNSIDEQGRLLP